MTHFPKTAALLTTLCLSAGLAGTAHAQSDGSAFGLGKASQFAVLNLSGQFQFNNPQSSITGAAGAVTGTNLNFADGSISGPLYLGTGVSTNIGNVHANGGIVTPPASDVTLNQAAADAKSASATLAGKAADQTFATLNNTVIITGHSGLNVIDTGGINFSNGTLTFEGPSDAQFVVNDSGSFAFSNSQFLAGTGVSPYNILFNVTGGNIAVTGGGPGILDGILLDPNGDISYHDDTLSGALIGNNIAITSAGKVIGPQGGGMSPVPEPSQTATLGLGVLGLACLALKARKRRMAA